jgi:hypothetical protein
VSSALYSLEGDFGFSAANATSCGGFLALSEPASWAILVIGLVPLASPVGGSRDLGDH